MFVCLFVFLLSFMRGLSSASAPNCTPTSPLILQVKKPVYEFKYINIDDASQLRFECDLTKYTVEMREYFNVLLAFKPIVMNRSIDMTPFSILNMTITVALLNLKGIDIEMNGPILRMDDPTHMEIQIANSRLDFYLRGRVIDDDLCDYNLLSDVRVSMFSRIDSLGIMQSIMSRSVCPFVFKNSRIQEFRLGDMETDSLSNQLLRFGELKNSNDSLDLQTYILDLVLEKVYNFHLKRSFFEPRVFGNILKLYLRGKVLSIEDDIFKSLAAVAKIHVKLLNLRELLHSSFNAWMASLFTQGPEFADKYEMLDGVKNQYEMLELIFYDEAGSYDYPDEDFCLFRHFPGNKSVFTAMLQWKDSKYKIPFKSGLCTTRLLQQNNMFLNQFTGIFPEDSTELPSKFDLEMCNFKARLLACFNVSFDAVKGESKSYTSYYDSVYILKWVDFIGPVITFPLFTAVGFVLNLVIIFVITSKKNKKNSLFDSKIFSYILANSAFNCIECGIYELRLLNICISKGSIYCSSVKSTDVSLFIGVYVVGYVGETVKTCSMFTGLLFSLQRYVETSKTENRALKRIAKFPFTNVLVTVILTSLFLSSSKIFEYSNFLNGDSFFDSPMQFSINNYSRDAKYIWTYLYFIHYFLNDLLLLIINFVIDMKLVYVIRRDMAQKLKFTDGKNSNDKKLQEKKQAVDSKTNKLIVFNVIFYAFCRLPEFGMYAFFYFYRFQEPNMVTTCQSRILCYLLANTSEYLYMLGYTFNIIIYYKFNSNFKTGFRNFFNMKRKATK